MKQTITTNWNFVRFLRLGMGLAIMVQAILARDVVFAIAGLVFTGMAVFNVGCCGAGGCSTNTVAGNENNADIPKQVVYEEVV